MHHRLCPDYLYNCLPPLVSATSNYGLRNNNNYTIPRYRLRISEKSFIPSTVEHWNSLDLSIRNSPTLNSFKNKVKGHVFKPPKYYYEGNRKLNVLHTRLRHRCSSLNPDLARINLVNSPKCACGSAYEDAIHYLLECCLYQNERRIIFRNLNDTDLNIETLLFGNDDYSDQINSEIFEKVRIFIRQSKRFQ